MAYEAIIKEWRGTLTRDAIAEAARVSHLLPEDSDISETEWLQAATANPAFDFLKDPEEDIYTLSDGRLFYDEGQSRPLCPFRSMIFRATKVRPAVSIKIDSEIPVG